MSREVEMIRGGPPPPLMAVAEGSLLLLPEGAAIEDDTGTTSLSTTEGEDGGGGPPVAGGVTSPFLLCEWRRDARDTGMVKARRETQRHMKAINSSIERCG